MYQCLDVCADSAPSATPSPPASTPAPGITSGVSEPSGMFLCIVDQPAYSPAEGGIGQEKVDSKKCHRHRYNDGGGNHIRARRPVHMPHFHAHIVKERLQPLGPGGNLAHRLHKRKCIDRFALLLSIKFCFVRHSRLVPSPRCVQSGLTPPTSNLA